MKHAMKKAKLKRLIAIILAIVMILTTIGISCLQAFAAASSSTDDLQVHVKVGQTKTIDFSSSIPEGCSIVGMMLPTSDTGNAICTFPSDAALVVRGISAGVCKRVYTLSSGQMLSISITITGKQAKHKSYNPLTQVTKTVKGKTFRYDSLYFERSSDKQLLDVTCVLTNVSSKGGITPDIKIKFYNKQKKLVGVYQDSAKVGSNWNITLSAHERYGIYSTRISASSLGVSERDFASISYFRVVKI
jgi:hypothetical protein